jgi:hypothetical protein
MFKSQREKRPDGKIGSVAAGYMELQGAVKDGGCEIVAVDGGVSKRLGCCNLFKPKPRADEFRCGECKYITG